MPSSHAANWFAATMICYVFYRRSWRFMLPLACLVSFSRIYNGVHYPSDVLAGAILGAGYAAAGMWAIESLWRFAGQRWFPLWWEQLPSLVNIRPSAASESTDDELPPLPDETLPAKMDAQWLHLGYLFIAFSLLANLLYLASGLIGLSEDEAYQWVWSKHLALSYYSKPPLIAYTQWLGTHIWGDTDFGVRFFSPVIGAILGFLLLRFFAREVNARAGFFLALIVSATPLARAGFRADDHRSAFGFILDRGNDRRLASRPAGRQNARLALDRSMAGSRLLKQIHRAAATRLLDRVLHSCGNRPARICANPDPISPCL